MTLSFFSNTEAEYVDSVSNHVHKMERKLYDYCKKYFYNHYKAVFFSGDDIKEDIFHESFITLWEQIEQRKIYALNGVLYGKSGEVLTVKLTTYFMGIAKLKYMELARSEKNAKLSLKAKEKAMTNLALEFCQDQLYDYEDEKQTRLDIIADCISKMAERCKAILNKFYYEEKTLDEILMELPTFMSKNALKTAKYKCIERLHKIAKISYNNSFEALR